MVVQEVGMFSALRAQLMVERDREEMKKKLQSWLVDEHFTIQGQDDPQAYFAFKVTNVMGIIFVVGQAIGSKDQIVVQGSILFDTEQTRKLKALKREEREDFLWDLRFELIHLHLGFNFLPDGLNPERIVLNLSIFYDGITKDSFMQTLQRINEGIIMVLWKIQRKFGAPAPREEQHTGVI